MKPWCEATTPSLASRDRIPILLTHRQALLAPSTHAMAPDAHHGAMPNPLGTQPWNAMDRIVNLHRSRAASPRCGGYDVEESPRRPGQPSMSRLIPAAHLPTAFRLTPRGEPSAGGRGLARPPTGAVYPSSLGEPRLTPSSRTCVCWVHNAVQKGVAHPLRRSSSTTHVLQFFKLALHCTALHQPAASKYSEPSGIEWSGVANPNQTTPLSKVDDGHTGHTARTCVLC